MMTKSPELRFVALSEHRMSHLPCFGQMVHQSITNKDTVPRNTAQTTAISHTRKQGTQLLGLPRTEDLTSEARH